MQVLCQHPLPLEETDPELAEHLRLVANKQHPDVLALVVDRKHIRLRTGIRVWETKFRQTPGRNDPCNCGSGIKAKKCCFRG